MSQPVIHNVPKKNLDKYIDSQIESISSDYAHQHPLPPPNDIYYDQHYKKKKSKHHHEPLPNIQILGHTTPSKPNKTKTNKTTKQKKKKKKKKKDTNTYGGSITPPPPTKNTNDSNQLSLESARSASPPNNNNKNTSYNKHHKNGRHNTQNRYSPPLTANIAEIEQTLQQLPLTTDIKGLLHDNRNGMKPPNTEKAKKILGVDASFEFSKNKQSEKPPQNRKKKLDSISHSICSIESLDADDGTGFNPRERRILLDEINTNKSDESITDSSDSSDPLLIESVKDNDDDKGQGNNEGCNKKIKPKIRMWNALAYGLEDPIEGKTFEWVDSKYVRLLQLSTYSTVMGPKVKFVWKNSEIYNIQSLNITSSYDRCNGHDDNDDDDSKEDITPPRKVRPEFAYHELEAWIAKQTLDCTGWKNKHNKTAPPPFTKKTMIAPEFGVVLCCIQFDSSLRALRNKQFNQYINGIYTHTPANVNHHGSVNVKGVNKTPKTTGTQMTPNKSNYRRFMYKKDKGGVSDSIAPTSSPYDHTTPDDSSPGHQLPSSYSNKSYSSRYSSPPSGYNNRHVGDTLADYLSKFAPFSFSAGLSAGMNVSGANIPQIPYNDAMNGVRNGNGNGIDMNVIPGGIQQQLQQQQQQHVHNHNANNSLNMHHIDDNEDPDDIGHYSLVLAVEYKYYEKFIESLNAIEHWLYMIAGQIRYLLALNKCFKCDQMENSLKLHTDINSLHGNSHDENDTYTNNDLINLDDDTDCPDRLHTIIPFMTNIAPTAIFKFDQLFSATFVGNCKYNNDIDMDQSISMSSSYLMDSIGYNLNYIPSRGLPERISLFDTWFLKSLDNRDKHKLSIMISSHLQTLGRTVIIGNDELEIDRYISTLALFSTSQQKSLSRLSVKVDNPNNLSIHYIPELFLQGIIIPTMKAPEEHINRHLSMSDNIINDNSLTDKSKSKSKSKSTKSVTNNNNNRHIDSDYAATVAYLQGSPAIKKLQEDLYLAPGPSTLVFLTSSKHIKIRNGNNNEEEKQSFWWIRQTAMPHKFKQEQQSLLFQKIFYLRRRSPRRRNSSSYIYGRKRSANLFGDSSPSRNIHRKSNDPFLTPPHTDTSKKSSPPNRSSPLNKKSSPPNKKSSHHRTLEREKEKERSESSYHMHSGEFKSMNKIYQPKKALNEDHEHNGDTIDNLIGDATDDEINNRDDNESVTTSIQSVITSIQSSTCIPMPQPIHAPHSMNNGHNKDLTFVEPSLSPMIATVVFGSFNIPQELKMTFLETQFRILLEKASEILLYIEHEQKDLLSFYDKTCHVMSCKEFKEQVPMEALYPQIMQKFESQLRSDLQISRQEDLYVLLSISEGFRPNLFSLMFGNPVFDIEVADILRYFLF